MKKIILLVSLCLVILLSGCTQSSEQKTCEKQGGNWIVGSAEYGSRCIMPYPDAGKECTSSDQCEGLCVTNVISQMGKKGECQKDNDSQGCWNAIESERFKCLFDDIMMSCDGQYWDNMCNTYKGKAFFE